MKKIFNILTLLLISTNLFSTNVNLDVYGVDDQTANIIIKNSRDQIEEYVEMESKIAMIPPAELDRTIAKHMLLRDKIVKKIKQYGKFELVEISTGYYPDKNIRYTTIDIVPSSQIFRIPHSAHRVINKTLKLTHSEQKLFSLWCMYNENNINLINQGRFDSKEKTCPVSHCMWGFSKEELTLYLPKFKKFANAHHAELENIIRFSPNDEQRGDAIFILANSDNYQSVAKFLFNYINDQSALVRNNSLRVIAAILSTHKIENLPLHNLLQALNYPLVTDRNKAADVLYNIASHDNNTHKQIITESGGTLIELLKLKQPNNHNVAYNILKVISNKNHIDTDIEYWKYWLGNYT